MPRQRKKKCEPDPPPPAMRDNAAFNLISAAQLVRRNDDAHFEAVLGISLRQFISLIVIIDRPGLSASQLARQLQITAQSATTLIQILNKLGYIQIERPMPGQRLKMRISAKGEKMVERGRHVLAMMDNAKKARFEPGEWQELNRLLIKLVIVFPHYKN